MPVRTSFASISPETVSFGRSVWVTVSGLIEAKEVLTGIKGIRFVHLTSSDVVRHPLVQEIIDAYEGVEIKKRNSGRGKKNN